MRNNLAYIMTDSCRYDSHEAASMSNMGHLDAGEKRYSFTPWTSPSHFVLLMGAHPCKSPAGVFASEVYKDDLVFWKGPAPKP